MAPLHTWHARSYANETPQWHSHKKASPTTLRGRRVPHRATRNGHTRPKRQAGPRCRRRSGPDGRGADTRPAARSDPAPVRSSPFYMFSSCSRVYHDRPGALTFLRQAARVLLFASSHTTNIAGILVDM